MIVTAEWMEGTHGILLRRCQQVALAIFTEEASDFGFSPTQYSVLAFIHIEPGINQNMLGDHIALDRSSVTKCGDTLEERGLLKRIVDKNDRRARLLHITDEGAVALAQVHEAALKARRRIEAAMGRERFENFIEDMKAFCDVLR